MFGGEHVSRAVRHHGVELAIGDVSDEGLDWPPQIGAGIVDPRVAHDAQQRRPEMRLEAQLVECLVCLQQGFLHQVIGVSIVLGVCQRTPIQVSPATGSTSLSKLRTESPAVAEEWRLKSLLLFMKGGPFQSVSRPHEIRRCELRSPKRSLAPKPSCLCR